MNYIYSHRYGGFANSLCIWQFCYELAKINNIQVAIYKYHFPESKFLNFPNTILLENEPNNLHMVNSNEIADSGFILPKNKNIGLSCGWGFSRKLEHENSNRAVSNIEFYDANLNESIKSFCKNKIGIHLRRGDHNHYTNIKISDDFYATQCDKYSNFEFYLSTDANKYECNFLNKYKIITYKQFLNVDYDTVNCHSSGEPNRFKQNMYNIDENLIKIKCIDLFALSRCDFIIGCKNSTFSLIASYMGNNKKIITD